MAAEQLTMDADLAFVLDEKCVPKAFQDKLAAEGVRTLSVFAHMADTPGELRQVLKEDWDLDPGAPSAEAAQRRSVRTTTAYILDAWTAATVRISEANKRDAERRADRLPKVCSGTEHVLMRRSYETAYGRTTDKIWPSTMFIEKRLEQIENGTLEAEPLTRVIPQDLATSNSMDIVTDTRNLFRLKEGMKDVPMPKNSEELRARIRTLAITFYLAKLRHGNRAFLGDAVPNSWEPHIEYILGEQVAGLEARGANGQVLHTADWNLVLSYEHQVRREAIRLILFDTMSLGEALTAARKDTQLKERYFNTPLSFSACTAQRDTGGGYQSKGTGNYEGKGAAKSRAAKRALRRAQPYSNDGGGKGNGDGRKGSGKGKGRKGKGKGSRGNHQDLATTTPDGRKICFKFNEDPRKCTGSCGFVHVCRRCFATHAASSDECRG